MSEDKAVNRRWFLVGVGVVLNGAVALLIATPVIGYLLGPIRKKGGYDSWIALGDVSDFPVGRNTPGQFCDPGELALGWRDQEGGMLGPPNKRREVPDFCHQLRAPGMPRPLVSSIRALYVSLSRWGLLRRWLPCCRTTATWACSNTTIRCRTGSSSSMPARCRPSPPPLRKESASCTG